MKTHAARVYLALIFASGSLTAFAANVDANADRAAAFPKTAMEATQATPATLKISTGILERHLFPVRDEKGLLLTCVAPEIETNQETDLFENCSLAPGRTLDDVMHSFVRGIHAEQHQQAHDRVESDRDGEQKAERKHDDE